MSTENTTKIAASEVDAAIQSAHKLVTKLIQCEQDPDLLSVFSIARAHGYKVTSQFWHPELNAFVVAYEAYNKAKDAPPPKALAPVEQFPVDMPQG